MEDGEEEDAETARSEAEDSKKECHNYVARQVARLISNRNSAVTIREEPRFTTRNGVRRKPDVVVQSGDQMLVIELVAVWDANDGVLKHKASEKAANPRIQKRSST
ncbi:hypothetical protein HPB51_024228 [Rhipicephalus microplus]|uniref:Uncharacterized protein n=1 Tax=Rhipicephalus microplus TaxID=6941 RepID=A0A9J6DXW5_RHIMP|nr:hypothetical protein HPB51_024228 [Rhipicephalus microplus]